MALKFWRKQKNDVERQMREEEVEEMKMTFRVLVFHTVSLLYLLLCIFFCVSSVSFTVSLLLCLFYCVSFSVSLLYFSPFHQLSICQHMIGNSKKRLSSSLFDEGGGEKFPRKRQNSCKKKKTLFKLSRGNAQ